MGRGIALAMAKKIAPAALAALPAGDVEIALRQAMHQAIGEPRITLRAAPAVAEVLEQRLADIAHEEGYEGRVAMAAGVPVIPATEVLGDDFDAIRLEAAAVGYPLMLKASWGGGGRGMRPINNPEELADKVREGRREGRGERG